MPRNNQLIQERNRRIAETYHQLDHQGLRYSIILQAICKAFYLSEYRVQAIIRQMVKEGTFVQGEPLQPARGRRHDDHGVQLTLQLSLS